MPEAEPPPAPAGRAARACIGLGANLGDAAGQVRAAVQALAALDGMCLVAHSSLYLSAPLDAGGPDYVNAVAVVDTTLPPRALLRALQAIETRFGRERPFPNAPRTLDLDLLLYGTHSQADPVLTLPHPRLHQRAFVLRPLAEVAPDLSIPGLGRVADLLPSVADQRIVRLQEAAGASGPAALPAPVATQRTSGR